MQERAEEIAKLVVLENGKPFKEAKGEVNFALGYFDWFAFVPIGFTYRKLLPKNLLRHLSPRLKSSKLAQDLNQESI